MRRVIGIDIHRTFGEVVIWEDGRLRSFGRVDMTRTALEGLGGKLHPTDEVVIEATGNSMAVSRVLSPFVQRVVIANPLQVKAIAHAHVKTDKVDAGTLANLFAAGLLPEIWTPDAETERKRRLTARRYQVVRHRTRIKNEVHAILHAHLVPKCPHSDLFNRLGREWLKRQALPDDEREAIGRHLRELDRLGEDLAVLDREIAEGALYDGAVKRLITITGVNLTVAAGMMAAIGDISRFDSPGKLVSYFGLNPRVRQSGLGAAHHGRISKVGRSHARAMLVEAAGPLHAFFVRIRARRGHQIAAVALARKLTVLCWHVLTKDEDYLWARPALVANKTRAIELQAGRPQNKGNRRGLAYRHELSAARRTCVSGRATPARVARVRGDIDYRLGLFRSRPPLIRQLIFRGRPRCLKGPDYLGKKRQMKVYGKVRPPREEETALMKLLVSGSRALDSGPVGRCSSRGWIRYVELDDRNRGTYELTPLGRAQLEAHLNGTLVPER